MLLSPRHALLLVGLVAGLAGGCSGGRPESGARVLGADALVDLRAVAPTVAQDMRYVGSRNFLGRPVAGYQAPTCLVTPPAAAALAAVQAGLEPFGLGLKVYDCYRPQRAVDDFVAWAADPSDTLRQALYYPAVPKDSLFAQGYIAERSGHSRGSTVDVTLVPLAGTDETGEGCAAVDGLDMGTGWDCFSPRSHTADSLATPQQRANRLLLRSVMERHGFRNYPLEWWHYTLADEPFPDTYFDRPIR